MSKNAVSQSSAQRPDVESDRDNPNIAAKELEGRPLRSLDEILNEWLDRRDNADVDGGTIGNENHSTSVRNNPGMDVTKHDSGEDAGQRQRGAEP
jgi:hypothetical protein